MAHRAQRVKECLILFIYVTISLGEHLLSDKMVNLMCEILDIFVLVPSNGHFCCIIIELLPLFMTYLKWCVVLEMIWFLVLSCV